MELSEFTATLARMTPANLHAVARSHAEHHGSPPTRSTRFRAVVHIDTVLRKQARTRDAAQAAYAATRAVAGAAEAGDILLPDPEVTQVARARRADRPRDRRRSRGRTRCPMVAARVVLLFRRSSGAEPVRSGLGRVRSRRAAHRSTPARAWSLEPVPRGSCRVRPPAARSPRSRLPRVARRDVGPPPYRLPHRERAHPARERDRVRQGWKRAS